MHDYSTFPFWEFSLALYRRPGAEAACLALQERCGADVNLLLFCCWAGATEGRPLDEVRLRQALDAVREWQAQVVGPLRALRRRLKAGPSCAPAELRDALRRQIAAAELGAEYGEQRLLSRAAALEPQAAAASARRAATGANLEAYLRLIGALPDEAMRADVEALLAACVRGSP